MRFSVAVPRWKKTQVASMLRKYRRVRRPGGLRREYKKLRSLLPGATRSHHLRKKVGVVEAAYQYICELQTALLDKFSTKGVPEDLAGVVRGKVATASDIQALALHLINNSATNSNSITGSPYIPATPLALPRLILPSASELDATLASTNRSNLPSGTSHSVTHEVCESLPTTTPLVHFQCMSSCNTFTCVPTVSTSQPDSITSSSPKTNTLSSVLPDIQRYLTSCMESRTSSVSQSTMIITAPSSPSSSSSSYSSVSSSSSTPMLIEEL